MSGRETFPAFLLMVFVVAATAQQTCTYTPSATLQSGDQKQLLMSSAGSSLCATAVVLDVAGGNSSNWINATYHVGSGQDAPVVPPIFRVVASRIDSVWIEYDTIRADTAVMFSGSQALESFCLLTLSAKSVRNVTVVLRNIEFHVDTAVEPAMMLRGVVCIEGLGDAMEQVAVHIHSSRFKIWTMNVVRLQCVVGDSCHVRSVNVSWIDLEVEVAHPSPRGLRGLLWYADVTNSFEALQLVVKHVRYSNTVCLSVCAPQKETASVFFTSSASSTSNFVFIADAVTSHLEALVEKSVFFLVRAKQLRRCLVNVTHVDVRVRAGDGGVVDLPGDVAQEISIYVSSCTIYLGHTGLLFRESHAGELFFVVSTGARQRSNVIVCLEHLAVSYSTSCVAQAMICRPTSSWSVSVLMMAVFDSSSVGPVNASVRMHNVTAVADVVGVVFSDLVFSGVLTGSVLVSLLMTSGTSNATISITDCDLSAKIDVNLRSNGSSFVVSGGVSVYTSIIIATGSIYSCQISVQSSHVAVRESEFRGIAMDDLADVSCSAKGVVAGLNVTSVMSFVNLLFLFAACGAPVAKLEVRDAAITIMRCFIAPARESIVRRSSVSDVINLGVGVVGENASLIVTVCGSTSEDQPLRCIVSCAGCVLRSCVLLTEGTIHSRSLMYATSPATNMDAVVISDKGSAFVGSTTAAPQSFLFAASSSVFSIRSIRMTVVLEGTSAIVSSFSASNFLWNDSSFASDAGATWNGQPLTCATTSRFLGTAALQLRHQTCDLNVVIRDVPRTTSMIAASVALSSAAVGRGFNSVPFVQLASSLVRLRQQCGKSVSDASAAVNDVVGESWVDHPTRLALGARTPLVVGTIVGNLCFVIGGAFVASCFVWAARRFVNRCRNLPRRGSSTFAVTAASTGAVLYASVLQPTASACAALLADRNGPYWFAALAVVGVVLVGLAPVSLLTHFSLCGALPLVSCPVARRLAKCKSLWQRRWQRFIAQYVAPRSVWRAATQNNRHETQLQRACRLLCTPVIEPYRKGRHWFGLVELGSASCLGAVTGAASSVIVGEGCSSTLRVLLWVVFGMSAASAFAAVGARPYASVVGNAQAVAMTSLCAVCALLVALGLDESAATLSVVINAAACLSAAGSTIVICLDVHFRRRTSKAHKTLTLPRVVKSTTVDANVRLAELINTVCRTQRYKRSCK